MPTGKKLGFARKKRAYHMKMVESYQEKADVSGRPSSDIYPARESPVGAYLNAPAAEDAAFRIHPEPELLVK